MNRKHSYTVEKLRQSIKASSSIAQVLRLLGVVPAGGNYETVKRQILAENIDTSHFTGSNWRKGRHFQPVRPLEYYYQRDRINTVVMRKRLITEGVLPRKCTRCRRTRWLGEPIPLELDHVNGDRTNNTKENLRLLCPNCHAKTATYRGRNIGSVAQRQRQRP